MNDTLPNLPTDHDPITTTYHIDVLGRLWMPTVPAANDYTINNRQIKRGGDGIVVAGDLWIEDGVTELQAIDHWLALNTGDFSQIIATRITKTERAIMPWPGAQAKEDNDWHISVHYSRETILRDFTEEQEIEYNDCMYRGSDDD